MKSIQQYLALIILTICGSYVNAQTEGVSIKTTIGPPHPTAMLDIESSSKGLLIPRVTLLGLTNSAAPIVGPIEPGLMVFNKSGGPLAQGFYYWNGTQWIQIGVSTGTGIWSLIGAGPNIYYSAGKVRIGASTPAPTANLDIIEPSQTTKLFNFEHGSGFLSFVGSASGAGVGNYLEQTAKGLLSCRFSHIYSDGTKGVELTSFNQGGTPYGVVSHSRGIYLIGKGVAIGATNAAGTSTHYFYFNDNGTTSFTSDSTLKTNILTEAAVADKIKALRPVTFRWKAPGSELKNHGFIAQEVESIFPELVNTNYNDVTEQTTKSVNYTGLISILVKGMQEQQDQINTLKNRIADLEKK
jgi:hypothetical protein